MPPIQPSLRGSLLTGASALALSVSGAGAQAQSAHPTQGQNDPPLWTVWVEGALFQTGGGSFNIPSIPGLGAPFTSFNPQGGLEGAFGFDYQWDPNQPWHFVFDFRYGKSRTASSSSSSSSANSSTSFFTSFGFFYTNVTNTANSSATQATEWESHLVADFLIGRDLGVGVNKPELEFGIRVADLRTAARAEQTGNSTTTTNITKTFYSASSTSSTSTASTSTWASAAWNSHFFGVGPRAAITGGIPIVGFWSFDYDAGIAGLIGDRSFNFSMTTSTGGSFFTSSNPTVFVFNTDGWAALSYSFTPYVKLSGGIRGDFYDSALTTYNVNTGGLTSIDRLYWGPFLRLTGKF